MSELNATALGIPQWWQFMHPVLQVASDGKDWARRDLYSAALDLAGVSDELRAVQYETSGNFAAENRVGWAKSALTRARLLETARRGVFRITDTGREFLASHPRGFTQSDLQALHAWDEYEVKRRASVAIDNDAPVAAADVSSDPDELLDAAESATEQSVAVDLLQRLRDGDWQFFERTVRRMLTAMGYGTEGARLRSTRSGDGGIDGVINRDALGLDRIYIQAKRFRDASVDSDTVRTFLGSLDTQKASFGVFFTTSRFTKDAEDAADRSSKSVVLVDGQELAKLMIRYRVGTQVRRTVEVVEVDEDFFE
ncbi:restriction endonuclease [Cellulomonas cellasea]|uniref:restriction endonuclease n=1 Tax=Cellulomonas cellasea TaxID=43670 RepID=UPI0025A4C8EF|nr:restriction endonuclease [Cellulomonas cellasea]